VPWTPAPTFDAHARELLCKKTLRSNGHFDMAKFSQLICTA